VSPAKDDHRTLSPEQANELDELVRESLRQLLATYVRLRSEYTGVDESNGA